MHTKPKLLFLDIETRPITAYTWGTFDQNVGLNQIISDWSILCWAAKWEGDDKVFFESVRYQENRSDDSQILKGIWELMDEADIICGQNSNSFDIKKLNARFLINKMQPPSSYQKVDTKVMAKKIFRFTSNKLEYMTEVLNEKYKKLKHGKFPGFELWTECMKGNQDAWDEMELYNKHDVLALEELYQKLIAWDNPFNANVYHKMHDNICTCGSTDFTKYGWRNTKTGKFQRFKCVNCGKEHISKHNELSSKKKSEMFR